MINLQIPLILVSATQAASIPLFNLYLKFQRRFWGWRIRCYGSYYMVFGTISMPVSSYNPFSTCKVLTLEKIKCDVKDLPVSIFAIKF